MRQLYPVFFLGGALFAQSAKTCSGEATSKIDPAGYVQLFEDPGNDKRIVLHSPTHPATRLLRVDTDSTIIVDLSKVTEKNCDLTLNKFYITATLTKAGASGANASKSIEVVNYAEVGKAADSTQAQKAFAFQTFDNVAGKLLNLYYTTKDIIVGLQGEDCFNGVMAVQTPADLFTNTDVKQAADRMAAIASCKVDDYRPPASTGKSAKLDSVGTWLKLYGPEAQTLTSFFSDDSNHLVNSMIARRIFNIDVESLQAISTQIKANVASLSQNGLTSDAKYEALWEIYYRLLLIANDLSYVHDQIAEIGRLAGNDAYLLEQCERTFKGRRTFIASPSAAPSASLTTFAQACYIEREKNKYVTELSKYLVPGTISLADNAVGDGDIIVVTVEARGPDVNGLGAQAQFRIRATNYGMKGAVRDSVMFIKRIGVNEADANRLPVTDPAHGLTPVRFSPYPGVSLVATFFRRGGTACTDCGDGKTYLLPDFSGKQAFLHALAPGIGVNVTFMTFKDPRDFNATTGTFTNTTGNTFELGTGAVVSLFNHRVSATFGWDLMAPARREYWGLGFSFIDFAKDMTSFFKKN